jgi:hypothetical protein
VPTSAANWAEMAARSRRSAASVWGEPFGAFRATKKSSKAVGSRTASPSRGLAFAETQAGIRLVELLPAGLAA